MAKWKCKFKTTTSPITVGDKLVMACEEDLTTPPSSPLTYLNKDLQIVFPNKKDQYRLKVLKTLYTEKNSIDLEVVTYRTGKFQGDFLITDGINTLEVKPFAFEVASVLSKNKTQNQKSHPPFGPWLQAPSALYSGLLIFSIILFCSFLAWLIFIYNKRKTLSKTIQKRIRSHSPSKVFIKNLRLLSQTDSKKIEHLFRVTLENLFCIFAVEKKPHNILFQLRKYHPRIYKKYKSDIFQIFKEFEALKTSQNKQPDLLKIQKLCKNLIFSLEEALA